MTSPSLPGQRKKRKSVLDDLIIGFYVSHPPTINYAPLLAGDPMDYFAARLTGDSSVVRDKIEATVSVASALMSHEGRYKCNSLHDNYHYLHIVEAVVETTTIGNKRRYHSSSYGNSLKKMSMTTEEPTVDNNCITDKGQKHRRGDTSYDDVEDYQQEIMNLMVEYPEEDIQIKETTEEDDLEGSGSNGMEVVRTRNLFSNEEEDQDNDNSFGSGDDNYLNETLESSPTLIAATAESAQREVSDAGNQQFPGPVDQSEVDWRNASTTEEALSWTATDVVGMPAREEGEWTEEVGLGGVVETARVDLEEDANGNISAKKVLTWSWTGPRDFDGTGLWPRGGDGIGGDGLVNRTRQVPIAGMDDGEGINVVGGDGGSAVVSGENFSVHFYS